MLRIISVSFIIFGFLWDVFEIILALYYVHTKGKSFSRTIISFLFYLIASLSMMAFGMHWLLCVVFFVGLVIFSIAFQHFMPYLYIMAYNLVKGHNIFDMSSFRKTKEEWHVNKNYSNVYAWIWLDNGYYQYHLGSKRHKKKYSFTYCANAANSIFVSNNFVKNFWHQLVVFCCSFLSNDFYTCFFYIYSAVLNYDDSKHKTSS